MSKKLKCPKCQSENVSVRIVTETKYKRRSVLWWVCIGWWWLPIKWLFFFWAAILVKLLWRGRQVTITRRMAVCHECGYEWEPAGEGKISD